MVRILIADDHALFNDGIKSLLSELFIVVAQVYDGNEVLPAIAKHSPDLILLDINLPSINGFDLATRIKNYSPNLKIVFLTMYNEQKFVEQARKLCVNGYLLKNSTKDDLILGVSKIMENQIFYDPKLKSMTINLHHDDHFVKKFALTSREIEIIGLLKTGLSTQKIAEKLYLAHETVKTHRKNIYYKLSISKSTDLVKFAIEHKL